MDHREAFARRLNDLIFKQGVRKKDCATAVGITTGALSQFFSKKTSPSFETLVSLADYFGVSIDYLVGRSDDPHKEEFGDK